MAVASPEKIAELNSLVQELQSTAIKDQKTAIGNLLAFLTALGDERLSPAEVLSPHVCSNVAVLVIDNFVKPCLGNQRGKMAMARADVTRPFRSIVETIHQFVDFDSPFPPLAWKQCRPLDYLLNHFADVLNSEVLASRCGQDYAAMITFLMRFRVYASNVMPQTVSTLCLRLLYLIEDAKTEPDDVIHFAEALGAIVSLPHFLACFGAEVGTVAAQLARCIVARHSEDCTKTTMKGQMHLVRCTNVLLRTARIDVPGIEIAFVSAIRLLLSHWHAAARRDGWRLEVIELVSGVLTLWMLDGPRRAARARPATAAVRDNLDDPLPALRPRFDDLSDDQLQLLHLSIWPTVSAMLDTPKCEFGFGTDRELKHYPCVPLQPVFDLGALAVHAAVATAGNFIKLAERDAVEQRDGALAAKRARMPLPQEDLIDKIRIMTLRKTPAPLWLHTLAVPFATAALDTSTIDAIVMGLLDFIASTGASDTEQVVNAAVAALVPRASPKACIAIWDAFAPRYLSQHVVGAEEATVSETAFSVLTKVILQCERDGATEELVAAIRIPPAIAPHILPGFVQAPQRLHPCMIDFLVAAMRFLQPSISPPALIDILVGAVALGTSADFGGDAIAAVADLIAHSLDVGEQSGVATRRGKAALTGGSALPSSVSSFISPQSLLIDSNPSESQSQQKARRRGTSSELMASVVAAVHRRVTMLIDDPRPEAAESAVRLTQLLLLLHDANLWAPPLDDDDMRIVGAFASSRAEDLAELLRNVSCFGAAAFFVGYLLSIVEERFRRTQFVNTPQPLAALRELLTVDATRCALFDRALCMWDPKQAMISAVGRIARKLLQHTFTLFALQPPPGGAVDLIKARDGVLDHLLRCVSIICIELRTNDIAAACIDPLVDPFSTSTALHDVLVAADLVGDRSLDVKPSTAAPRLLWHVREVGCLLLALGSPQAHTDLLALLSTLWARYRQGSHDDMVAVVCSVTKYRALSAFALEEATAASLSNHVETWAAAATSGEHGARPMTREQIVLLIGAARALIERCAAAVVIRLVKWVVKQCSDSSCVVRDAAATAVAATFDIVPNRSRLLEDVLAHLKPVLLSPPEHVARCATALATLVHVAVRCVAVQPEVVSIMLEFHATKTFAHRELVAAALRVCASRCGVEGARPVTPFLNHHLPRIVFDWLCVFKHRLDAFPFVCFACELLQEFILNYLPVLLPFALVSKGMSEAAAGGDFGVVSTGTAAVAKIIEVAQSMESTSESELLRRNIVPIAATCFALSSVNGDAFHEVRDGALRAWDHVLTQVGKQLCKDLVRRQADSVLLALLHLTSPGDQYALPQIDFASARSALDKLTTFVEIRHESFFSAHRGDRIHAVVTELLADVTASTLRRHEMIKTLCRFSTEWIDVASLAQPHALRVVLHAACCLIKAFPTLSDDPCEMIKRVWELLSQRDATLLAVHHPFVSSVLLSSRTPAAREALAVMNNVASRSPQHAALLVPGRAVLTTDWAEQSQSLLDISECESAATTTSATESGAQRAAARALQSLLDSIPRVAGAHAAQFFHNVARALDSSAAEAHLQSDSQSIHLLRSVATHLLTLAQDAAHEVDVRRGAMNALRSVTMHLLRMTDVVEYGDAAALPWEQFLCGCPSVVEAALNIFALVFRKIADLAFSGNIATMGVAAKTLRLVLSLESIFVKKVLERSAPEGSELATHLAPYQREKVASVKSGVATVHLPALKYPSITSAEMWRRLPRKSGVEEQQQFVRYFTAALLLQCTTKAEFLSAMAHLADCCFAFAEEALPLAFLHIVSLRQSTAVVGFRQELTACLDHHLWPRAAEVPVVARVFLAAINVMRLAHFSVFVTTGRKSSTSVRVTSSYPAFEGVEPVGTVAETLWIRTAPEVLARAAFECGQWHMAQLFVEIACEGVVGTLPGLMTVAPPRREGMHVSHGSHSRSAAAQHMSSKAKADAQVLQGHRPVVADLIARIGPHIGDQDVAVASRQAVLSTRQLLVASASNDWTSLLSLSDARMGEAPNDPESIQSVLRSLRNSGCFNTMLAFVRGLGSSQNMVAGGSAAAAAASLREALYDAAWRTAQWGEADLAADRDAKCFDASVFHSIRALQVGDRALLQQCVERGEVAVLGQLTRESALDAVVRWQVLRDVASAASSKTGSRDRRPAWVGPSRIAEALGGERCATLDIARLRILESVPALTKWAEEHVEATARRAIKLGLPRVALSLADQFMRSPSVDPASKSLSGLLRMRAKAHFKLGSPAHAVDLLCTSAPAQWNSRNAIAAAKWSHSAQLTPTTQILEQLDTEGVDVTHAHCAFTIAALHDALCRDALARVMSAEFRGKLETLRQASTAHKQVFDTLTASVQQGAKVDARVYKHANTKMSLATRELQSAEREERDLRDTYAIHRNAAMVGFGTHLVTATSGKHDIEAIFRLYRLWLENDSDAQRRVSQVDAHVDQLLSRIPTYKFLVVFPQLVVRLNDTASSLFKVVMAVAATHPFHTLWSVLAMANGDRFSEAETKLHSDKHKVAVARVVLDSLRSKPALGTIVNHIESLGDAYLELAFAPRAGTENDPHKTSNSVRMTEGARLLGARSLTHAPIPTLAIPVEPSGNYDVRRLPAIMQMVSSYMYVGGINAPKLLTMVTTTGMTVRQLLKSHDDLRQDAILEQIFTLCNTVMKSDAETRRRGLSMRAYAVVPLSPTSGLVQWVDNTMRFADYLVSTTGSAHQRHFPSEPSSAECRRLMEELARHSAAQKVQRFLDVCNNFTPAMHYFFLERYATPREWFARRVDYTRSVAVSSMIGHVCGLGDRHISNILIDTVTAEVVHIDFGFAFEQGKLLPIPEIVPFRLTRDLVDGMGVEGTNGVFRMACEATLKTLRSEREMLNTVLQAFIHDPIARWAVAVNHDESGAAQPAHVRQSTGDADRAVETVRCKLAGYEGGEYLSVGGQVTKLIDAATNLSSLAVMFVGWQAWV